MNVNLNNVKLSVSGWNVQMQVAQKSSWETPVMGWAVLGNHSLHDRMSTFLSSASSLFPWLMVQTNWTLPKARKTKNLWLSDVGGVALPASWFWVSCDEKEGWGERGVWGLALEWNKHGCCLLSPFLWFSSWCLVLIMWLLGLPHEKSCSWLTPEPRKGKCHIHAGSNACIFGEQKEADKRQRQAGQENCEIPKSTAVAEESSFHILGDWDPSRICPGAAWVLGRQGTSLLPLALSLGMCLNSNHKVPLHPPHEGEFTQRNVSIQSQKLQ